MDSWYNAHTDLDTNSAYGSHGNFIFEVPGHEGMGVHSGRTDRGGPTYNTHGCIRTTDEATEQINQTHATDPLTTITVHE